MNIKKNRLKSILTVVQSHIFYRKKTNSRLSITVQPFNYPTRSKAYFSRYFKILFFHLRSRRIHLALRVLVRFYYNLLQFHIRSGINVRKNINEHQIQLYSTNQSRFVIARDEYLIMDLGQKLGWASSGNGIAKFEKESWLSDWGHWGLFMGPILELATILICRHMIHISPLVFLHSMFFTNNIS